jgi:hypothetical protein
MIVFFSTDQKKRAIRVAGHEPRGNEPHSVRGKMNPQT